MQRSVIQVKALAITPHVRWSRSTIIVLRMYGGNNFAYSWMIMDYVDTEV